MKTNILAIKLLILLFGLSIQLMAMGTNIPKGVRVEIKREPACHVISVGINSYNLGGTSLAFTNSLNDAAQLAQSIRDNYWKRKLSDLQTVVLPRKKNNYSKEQLRNWNKYPDAYSSTDSLATLSGKDSLQLATKKDSILSKWLFQHTLLNEQASVDNLLKAFRDVIQRAGPEDTFIFDFSGYTLAHTDANGNPETLFIPYVETSLTDTTQLVKSGIPLQKLREMMTFIKARNQLVVIEASYSAQFSTEITQLLVETDSVKADISRRNRVLIVPSYAGQDVTFCGGVKYPNGPLHHFLLSLRQTSVFDLFNEQKKQVMLDVYRQEIACQVQWGASDALFYTQFIFEHDLQQAARLTRPRRSATRGGKAEGSSIPMIRRQISGSHALLIGTNSYQAWNPLKTPQNDVREVDIELREGYGFKTHVLLDAPRDTVLGQLIRYAQTLDSTSQLLIYVAGHGGFDEIFDDGYLVFRDSKPKEQDPSRQSYLFYSQLSNLLSKMPCRQIFLMLDVCFGGTFERRITESPCTPTKRGERKSDDLSALPDMLSRPEFISKKLSYLSRQMLSSGGKQEVDDFVRGLPNSPFNLLVMKQLQNRGGNRGFLTPADFYNEVIDLPSEPVLGDFYRHDPRGFFLFIPLSKEELEKRAVQPDIKSLKSLINR